MRIDDLRTALPDYAKDLRLNLGAAIGQTSLTEQQQWGVLLAAAIASRNELTLAAIDAEATEHLSAEAVEAAKAAAAVMAMNNVYYRFVHLASEPEYATLPARLRMNVIGKPGVDQVDFELWSLAVSAVNGCGRCIDAHEHAIREKGGTKEAVQDAVRLASIIHGVAVTLEAEDHFAAAVAAS